MCPPQNACHCCSQNASYSCSRALEENHHLTRVLLGDGGCTPTDLELARVNQKQLAQPRGITQLGITFTRPAGVCDV